MTRRVKTRCCGLSLQVGTKIIGFFSLVGYLIQLVISMMQSSGLDLEDGMQMSFIIRLLNLCLNQVNLSSICCCFFVTQLH